VRGFDPPDVPFGSGHRGVDLLGRLGQLVHSALPGSVTFAGRLAGRGVVVVDHGATRTTYEPVGARVQVGDLVSRGEVLGALEPFGSHCFPRACLHWGWIRSDTYLDPLLLVGGGPIRLLPLAPVLPGLPRLPWRPPVPPYAGLVARWDVRQRRHVPPHRRVLAPAPAWRLLMPRLWARPLLT
jgi:murein DD-endopeptidase MepM/ murein hydrolase activator NlpD